MKISRGLFLCMLLVCLNVHGQSKKIINKIKRQNNINYTISDSIPAVYDTVNYVEPLMRFYRKYYLQKSTVKIEQKEVSQIAQMFAMTGNYNEAIHYSSIYNFPERDNRFPMLTNKQFLYNKFYRTEVFDFDVEHFIDSVIKVNQMVLINEAHDFPAHRSFIYMLLPLFKKNGYKYLALETLSRTANDTILNKRTGVYTTEPIFGELIRYAYKLGFKLLPYDCNNCSSAVKRDSVQAANINSIRNKYANEKILVIAGYDHINKNIIHKDFFIPMAYHLKTRYNINFLSIDQERFSEISKGYYGVLYNSLCRGLPSKNIAVLRLSDSMKMDFMNPFGFEQRDIYIFHPPYQNYKGRPSWVTINNSRTYITVRIPRFIKKRAILIQAYYLTEVKSNNINIMIPADQHFVNKRRERLCLIPGYSYKIVCRGIDNHIIYQTVVHLNQ